MALEQFVYVLRRREGLDLAAFQAYWREVHGPKVAGVAEVLGIQRYVQVHTTDATRAPRTDPFRGEMAEPYDGVAELWVDRAAATGTPEEQQAAARMLAEDEAEFIGFKGSAFWSGVEHVFVGEQTPT